MFRANVIVLSITTFRDLFFQSYQKGLSAILLLLKQSKYAAFLYQRLYYSLYADRLH
jgi:hypothetical protein